MRKHFKTREGRKLFGILALLSGIASILSYFLMIVAWPFLLVGLGLAICAIVLGAIGMSKDRNGKGLAIAGFTIGLLAFIVPISFWIILLIAFARF